MDLGLANKTVIVIGGSSNLGRACTLAFAEEGSNVVIVARHIDDCEKVADKAKTPLGYTGQTVGFAEYGQFATQMRESLVTQQAQTAQQLLDLTATQVVESKDFNTNLAKLNVEIKTLNNYLLKKEQGQYSEAIPVFD